MSKMAQKIKQLRKERGLTQKQAATGIGIPLHVYQRVERIGISHGLNLLINIADFYSITTDYSVRDDMHM
jgi:transcriptional regulator with XRE-family HTH domain